MQHDKFAFTDKENEKNIKELSQWYDEIKDGAPEEMAGFFAARLDGYEEHMKKLLDNYDILPGLLPKDSETLLDLGCGTGLELDEIFKEYPNISVKAIDLSQAMLNELMLKHPDKNITAVCADYFDYDFGKECFDAAVSVQSMHHFVYEKKAKVYEKVYDALKDGGIYIESDYTAGNGEYEKLCRDFYDRQRAKFNVPDDVFVHIDIPLIMEHRKELLLSAGFGRVEAVDRIENTVVTVARK